MIPQQPLIDPDLRPSADLIAEGRAMAAEWTIGSSLFLRSHGVTSEAAYKIQAAAQGRIMQHAHIGFRSMDRTVAAMAELYEATQAQDVQIDRFGITLDWSMGYPPECRGDARRGTGIVLSGPEDFARITQASPAAAHFGDFMLGLPGAVQNVQAAIAAGATAIGNLGQYFTFRLPYWDDDIATTEATVTAIGLIAAQPVEILIHSNLDDGFAGLFFDVTSAFGMMLIEKHIVEDLLGGAASFCFGHHFSSPLMRGAFQKALAEVSQTPGTMLFGNTVAYQGAPSANYASLSSYLMADICALMDCHSGHAINPVPVTENQRIPDIEEILDAQIFAARLTDHAPGYVSLMDRSQIDALAQNLIAGGRAFFETVLAGLAGRGVAVDDPAALMLAIRRLGPKRMEALWGQGTLKNQKRMPRVYADWAEELEHKAQDWLRQPLVQDLDLSHLRIAIGTTDVHEHGAYLITRVLDELQAAVLDAGVAVDAEVLVDRALAEQADVIAVSTYNGVALSYAQDVRDALIRRGSGIPVLIGGKLNQIPEASNSDLPVDVSDEINALGVTACAGLDDMIFALKSIDSHQTTAH
ncbi:MAG: cobalamin-dependent protein [Roseobacter sp.]